MARTAQWTLALAAMLLVGQQATAGLIPTSVTITTSGSDYKFTYGIELPSDYTLKSGDYFTIYDFQGMVKAVPTAQPVGWTFSSAMTGPTPSHIAPTDDPTIPNLTFTYKGPNIVGASNLGQFSIVSIYGEAQIGDFTSKDYSTSQGRTVGNYTTTDVPSNVVKQTPEPATLAILGSALPLLGMFRLLRRKR